MRSGRFHSAAFIPSSRAVATLLFWGLVFFFHLFFCSSQASFGGALLPGQLVFPHASWHQRDISGNTGGNWIFMKGRDPFQPNEHSSSLVVFSPSSLQTHTHKLINTRVYTHTVRSHNHTLTRSARTCSIPAGTYSSHASLHSFISKARAHYIQQQNTHTHTDTHTHTPTHIWSNKTHRTWLVSWYNKHFNNIS